ncbi:TagF domain-containing protein [Glaciimonas soli]|uniref:DUF2094 domain-containing protein n=1 Tax=Glaciimonas soli TaxID=2590999 RepID=A0A843YY31_9BURK|nr:TagF domain-containing protein [Glaciimonas soli]MQR02092.1 DUF2094 domain-containing protein [Glaciimonas soli]
MSLDLMKWLPKFLQEGVVSSPALWGKLPSRADFIQHQLKSYQGEALQAWIATQLRPLIEKQSAAMNTIVATTPAARKASSPPSVSKRRRADASLWHDLSPPVSNPAPMFDEPEHVSGIAPAPELTTVAPKQPVMGHAGLPWCFVLPPGSLPFAAKDYVIGVWMPSSDKVGRHYPLVMIQTASLCWIKQHFSTHTQQPCEWLFTVARAMAKTVYADETQVDRPIGDGKPKDHLQTLTTQLDQLWHTMRPGWRELVGRASPLFDATQAQDIIGAPHPADPAPYLDGVRYLPWANWPKKLTEPLPQPAFWQQDLQGRFVAAAVSLNS